MTHGEVLSHSSSSPGMEHDARERWQLQPTTKSVESAWLTMPRLEVHSHKNKKIDLFSPGQLLVFFFILSIALSQDHPASILLMEVSTSHCKAIIVIYMIM